MIRTCAQSAARDSIVDLIDAVRRRDDSVVFTRGGKPVAALVDMRLFTRIRELLAEVLESSNCSARPPSRARARRGSPTPRATPRRGK